MVFTRKFSEFQVGATMTTGDNPVGLEAGVNTIWDFIGASGSIIQIITQDTTALAVGRWVKFDLTTQIYAHGLANNRENAEIAGVVLQILDPNNFLLQQSGYIPSGTPGFGGFSTNPNIFFLSDVALGMQTITEPTQNGSVSKPLFLSDSADSGWVICLMRGYVIGTPGPIPPNSGGGDNPDIIDHDQPGNTFQIGNWIRVGADNIYVLTDSSTLDGAQGVGVVIMAGDPTFRIQFSGYNSNTVTMAVNSVGAPIAITTPGIYYLSDVVPGAITPTVPTDPLAASKPAFISESALNGTGWVVPQRPLPNIVANNPIQITVTQPAHGFTMTGLVVKPRTGAPNVGTYELAVANTYNTSYGVGMIRILDVNTFTIQEVGYFAGMDQVPPVPGGVANSAVPLTNGVPYFLSASPLTAGQITTVEPTIPNFSKPMFSADQTNAGWILPMRPNANGGGGGGEDEIDFANCTGQSTIVLPAGVWTDIPCMEVTVTSNSINSRMVIDSVMNGDRLTVAAVYYRLVRNGVPVGVGVGGGTICYGRYFTVTFDVSYLFVDVPGLAGAVTYKIQAMAPGGNTVYLNTDSTTAFAGCSTMVVEEFV